jgi:hypothetical protein
MQGIIDLHHDIMFFVIIISIFVSWLLGRSIYIYYIRSFYNEEFYPSEANDGENIFFEPKNLAGYHLTADVVSNRGRVPSNEVHNTNVEVI